MMAGILVVALGCFIFWPWLVHRFRETNRVPRIYFYRHGL